jgi:glutamate synthase (NADPH/NADH) small chain
MNVPGENLKGVYSANEYLTRVNLMSAYDPNCDTPALRLPRVAVVGGGNVAMDAARTAKRMGAEKVVVVYRRGRSEMPARAEEVHHAEQEDIEFQLLTLPLEVLGTDKRWVRGLKAIRMKLGEPDSSGRRNPEPVPGTEFVIDCDMVISALGSRANPLLTATSPNLKLDKRGHIVVDESGLTSMAGVFAGGDIVRGSATVILAMGDGKRTARAINDYLQTHSQQKLP